MDLEDIGQGGSIECVGDIEALAPLTSSPLLDLPFIYSKTNGLIIQQLAKGRLAIALRHDADPMVLLEISNIVTLPFDLEFVSASRFHYYLSAHYGQGIDLHGESVSSDDSTKGGDTEKVIKLIDAMIVDAISNGVSDIHIEAYDSQLIVRVRRDGKLRERFRMSPEYSPAVIGRFKNRSQIYSSTPNTPQKGEIVFVFGETQMGISLSTMPGRQGERMVLRIPDTAKTDVALDLPGMSPEIQLRLKQVMAEPGGMIIVAGPMDSGITTTLYAALKQLNDGKRNIMTVESSVEYTIDGISQVQTTDATDISVATALAAVLLQDPDVIMISELPGRRTAEAAMKAALNGPLILTALQSDDAIGVISTLRELKVDRMLLGESLRGIISQRLVKHLCGACRVPAQAAGSVASRLGFDRGTGIFEPRGCPACDFSGFVGSVGVFEVVCIDDTLRRLINGGGDDAVISSYAFRNNPNLSSAARKLVISGETTAEEAIRIAQRHPV